MSLPHPTVLSPSHKSGFTRADELEAGEFGRNFPASVHAELAEAFPELSPADEQAMYAAYLAGQREREAVLRCSECNTRHGKIVGHPLLCGVCRAKARNAKRQARQWLKRRIAAHAGKAVAS